VLITLQHYHVTQRLVGTYSVGSKTKSIRPRLRPRPIKLQDQDQDRGPSETGRVIRPRSQTPRLMYLREEHSDIFHPDPIGNDGTLGFFVI